MNNEFCKDCIYPLWTDILHCKGECVRGRAVVNYDSPACVHFEKKETVSDLIKAFELLKAYCKNRECNKDCVFYRELRIGDNTEQYCGLCEIVLNDDEEAGS